MATTTVNVSVAAAGTSGQVQFNNGGAFGADSLFHWDNTNKRLGVGATPDSTVRLDVRAQGALSTDIAFRVRNSANTRSFLVVNGLGDVYNNGNTGILSNTFYGWNVGRNTTGVDNSFFGNDSGRANTTGFYNAFFGGSAGSFNTTGGLNCSFGWYSGYSNTIGVQNSYFGSQSGQNNTTGNNNCFIGHQSGRLISSGGNLTVANNSVFLGVGTRANADNETNQIVIGFQAEGTGSNSVTLGNTSITRTNLRGQIVITGFASAPTGVEGAIYYDSTTKKHYGFDGTNWNALY
jgi:hypothetical protein